MLEIRCVYKEKGELLLLKDHCHSGRKKDPLLLSGKFAIEIEPQQTEEKGSLVFTLVTYYKGFAKVVLEYRK